MVPVEDNNLVVPAFHIPVVHNIRLAADTSADPAHNILLADSPSEDHRMDPHSFDRAMRRRVRFEGRCMLEGGQRFRRRRRCMSVVGKWVRCTFGSSCWRLSI